MVNPTDRRVLEYALTGSMHILYDTDDGPVYWDFDFKKEEFQAGSVCNGGFVPEVTLKYKAEPSAEEQLGDLVEKAKRHYKHTEVKGALR